LRSLRVRIYRINLGSRASVIDQAAQCFRRETLATQRRRDLTPNFDYTIDIWCFPETTATYQYVLCWINKEIKPPTRKGAVRFPSEQSERVRKRGRIHRPPIRNRNSEQVTQ
jgi:hypothetical protein